MLQTNPQSIDQLHTHNSPRKKQSNHTQVECTIANRIKAKLSKSRRRKEFKYALIFNFRITASYQQSQRVPTYIYTYKVFEDYFPIQNVKTYASTADEPYITISFILRTLTATQVINVYERTLGLYQLVEDVNKHGLKISRILNEADVFENIKSNNIVYQQYLQDLKLSVHNYQSEYTKRCSLIIGSECVSTTNISNNINNNKITNSSHNITYLNNKKNVFGHYNHQQNNKRPQHFDHNTFLPPNKLYIAGDMNQNISSNQSELFQLKERWTLKMLWKTQIYIQQQEQICQTMINKRFH
eukprot:310277_1